jgi:type IV pilus assembly protein PilM
VADLTSIFKPAVGWRPRLACEIRPEGIVAARASSERGGGGELTMAFAPLAEGALIPGLKVPNITDRSAVVGALEKALGDINARSGELTIVVPDVATRVLLLDFDTLPARRQEALAVVRFRLRKMVPFDVETAAVSYQAMAQKPGAMSVLVTVMPGDVLAEYEDAAHEAGYEPGAVLPSTLAAAAALDGSRAALMVNHTGHSVTTAVTQEDEMLLHRSVELPTEPLAREEEMAQALITTLAWYEDTLRATPATLYYAGPGGAAAAARSKWFSFVDPAPQIEDLAPVPRVGTMSSIPAGVTAGVTGALVS